MHTLLVVTALLALFCLPCAIALILCADEALERAAWRMARRRDSWRERREIVRLERAVDVGPVPDVAALAELDESAQPSIERIAADLRRLSRHRLGVATRSPVWHIAVLHVYDELLRLACRRLGVAEHLSELGGMDLEIERVRVEGALQVAGLALRPADASPRRDLR